jgi:ribosomal peptide maturation radical SAM protein 1
MSVDRATPVVLTRKPVELSVLPPRLGEEVERRSALRVALVAMPMAAPDRPSLALGLLSAIGRAHGFTVDTLHAQLDFAVAVGLPIVRTLFEDHRHQLGDWFFTAEAFGADAPSDAQDVLDTFGDVISALADDATERSGRPVDRGEILAIRERVIPAYLDHLETALDWASYDVVGFTSTFQQNVASIAMARRIKAIDPGIIVIGGGANFEGTMGRELLRGTPWFDHAITGEADEVFPAFLAAVSDGTDRSAIPGVLTRRGDAVVGEPPPVVRSLDDLPTPDYDEYFARAEGLGLIPAGSRRDIAIPFESSRGCWWGAKRHCTFCGLNGATMEHRSKRPERVLAELAELVHRYRSFRLRATDNIMDERYLEELLPSLIEHEVDFELFYEMKANLDRRQIEMLVQAGVREIQPGIESLSSRVLRLMDKGSKSATNVNLLRWGTHHEMNIHWNVLCGFPGETTDDYASQADLAARIVHLQPPIGSGLLVMERFSPMFTDRERFPMRVLRPEPAYALIYPPTYDLLELAYYFEYEFVDHLPSEAFAPLHAVIDRWKEAWRAAPQPTLELWRTPDVIHIEDRRDPDTPIDFSFEGDLLDLYLACFDGPRSVRRLAEEAETRYSRARLDAALDGFTEHGLMMRDGNLCLSLALPRRRHARPGLDPS